MTIAVVVVAIVALSAGCSDPASVQPRLSALYVLRTINGHSLPATASQGGGQQYIVLADSLTFQPDGQVRRSYAVRWISSTPRFFDTVYTQVAHYLYVIEDRKLTIGFTAPCPPNAVCVRLEEGMIDVAAVRLNARLLWSGEPEFVFTRR
jgi:hypothetical protein